MGLGWRDHGHVCNFREVGSFQEIEHMDRKGIKMGVTLENLIGAGTKRACCHLRGKNSFFFSWKFYGGFSMVYIILTVTNLI